MLLLQLRHAFKVHHERVLLAHGIPEHLESQASGRAAVLNTVHIVRALAAQGGAAGAREAAIEVEAGGGISTMQPFMRFGAVSEAEPFMLATR